MEFNLSSEQKALKDLSHQFAEKEIVPVAGEYDREAKFPLPIYKKAFEVGLMNLNLPQEYGGAAIGLLEECLVGEELSWGCAGIGASIGINALAAIPILIAGTEEQKKTYLNRLGREFQLAAYCVTEPNAGSDVAGIRTKAERKGDTYLLTGQKMFITNASHAHFYLVFAYTDREKKHQGVSCFIVERDWEGVSVGKKLDKMGQRASDTAEVYFDQVKVPAKNLLGNEGDGFLIAMQVFDRSRPGVGISAVGVARRALEESIRYARERQAFGKPIFAFQGIGFMIADMAMKIEAARLLCYKAATTVDEGGRNTKLASYAKAFAADTCMEVTTNAVQIFGGYGFSKEYPVEKLMRDAKVFQIYEGTSQIQRVIIARELFKEGKP